MSYCRDYILIANFILMMFLPFLLITVMNSLMMRKIRETSRQSGLSRGQRRDRTVALLLSTVVIVFFCCNTIRFGINTFEVCYLVCYLVKTKVRMILTGSEKFYINTDLFFINIKLQPRKHLARQPAVLSEKIQMKPLGKNSLSLKRI